MFEIALQQILHGELLIREQQNSQNKIVHTLGSETVACNPALKDSRLKKNVFILKDTRSHQ